MFLTLKEKLDFEYSNFYMLQMLSPKACIYRSAAEIDAKRRITRKLSTYHITSEDERKLLKLENLLDIIYDHLVDVEDFSDAMIINAAMDLISEVKDGK